MKLDPTCIRDILFVLEEWLILNDDMKFSRLTPCEIRKSSRTIKYSEAEISYTLILLEEAGFIKAAIQYGSNKIYSIHVVRLTYEGHQFLDTIRPDSLWSKICSISCATGLNSIPALIEIANMLIPQIIKSAAHT